MTWTYIPSQLDSSTLYQVRLLVGDTDTTDQQMQDEEINFYLAQEPSVRLAAAEVCKALASKYARFVNASVNGVSESASDKAKAYRERAKELEADDNKLALPVFGGITVAEQQAADQDSSKVQPSFKIGMNDNPDAINERMTPRDEWPRWP